MLERARLEEIEKATLAPYAALASQSRGRAYAEGASLYRTAFQKDQDRVNHTTAFRRLQYKTQVFVNHEGDYYRTRLTHTLEVAQVARSIARALGLNQDLAQTIAFSHDLGHPPFGHSGETVLDQLMQPYGGFDHNQQSLRIVTYLEMRYAGWRGLNLCWETLEGIAKHEPMFDPHDARDYDPQLRPSLEAQLVNLSDEIAYYTHDLDDGLRSGLIVAAQLLEVPLLADLMQKLHIEKMTELERRTMVRELIGLLVGDTIHAVDAKLRAENIRSYADVQQHPQPLACYSEQVAQQLVQLRAFLYDNLYQHAYVKREVDRSEEVLTKLFKRYTGQTHTLPETVLKAAESAGIHRAVCDYIAGMTDRFALEASRD
jgi:dGTPase